MYPTLQQDNWQEPQREEVLRVPVEGPSPNLKPGIKPFLLINLGLGFVFYFVNMHALVPWINSEYSTAWIGWTYFHVVLFGIAYIFTLWSYVLLWRIQPSVVPDGWTPERDALDPLSSDGKIRYCEKCESWQPPRAYHCKYCKRCVLMQDQHCIWVNGCIGFGNTKQYMLFLWNLSVFFSISQIVSFWWVLMSFLGYEYETCYWGSSLTCWLHVGVVIASTICMMLVATLLGWQARLCAGNVTNQEVNQYTDILNRNKYEHFGGPDSEWWPYDKYAWERNVSVFMGRPKYWLIPGDRKLPGDGTSFPINRYYLKQREASKQKINEEEL